MLLLIGIRWAVTASVVLSVLAFFPATTAVKCVSQAVPAEPARDTRSGGGIVDWQLAGKLASLERSLVTLDQKTQHQFKEVYQAIRALTATHSSKRRPIGFTASLENKS